jgi:mannose-6-phosphate isomerase-like protein (cupin superfamily)
MGLPLPMVQSAQNYAVVHLGKFAELRQFTFATPKFPREVEGKVFLKQLLNLTSAEISLNNLPADKSVPFYHKHRLNEEIYIFVQGQGEFQVDGQIFPVQQGSIVRVAPEGERCLRNVSDKEDLCWIVIQARAGSYSDHTIEDGVGVARKVSWVGKHSAPK